LTDLREEQLLARARRGDLDAFHVIVERHQRQVYCLALEMTGSTSDAEDVVQDVFIKAYDALPGFRGEAKVSSWLYRIAINTCLDQARLQKWKQWGTFLPLREALGLWQKDYRSNPARVHESKEIRGDIEQAVRSLTPLERSIFVLRHHRELKIREIAEVLERSEGTVKNILFRAVRKLRSRLASYRPDFQLEESP